MSAAKLLADGGAAASEEEFFRCRPFLEAEGVTHTLCLGSLFAPLVVREVPGPAGSLDATSPYGYPGLKGPPGEQIDPEQMDLGPAGLITVFVRHRLDPEPQLAGATERNLVHIADPELSRKSRMSDRQQIRRNQRSGYQVEVIGGPQSSPSQRQSFAEIYEQTMRRAGAAQRYFFGADYFERVLSTEQSWLVLALAPGGELAAASIATLSDGLLHYYLSGTGDAHLGDSPMKNVVSALIDFAWERDLPLNLGGGVAPGDRLEEFKRGFANRTDAWRTSQIVCDPGAYRRLSAQPEREAGTFFPAYRAP